MIKPSPWRCPCLRAPVAILLLGVLALLPALAGAAVDPDDLLPVDDAFALQARAAGPGQIELEWDIAEGYYLYRHRISAAADPDFAAGELQLPPGEPHEDEFFGRVETYRDRLRAVLPGTARAESTVLTVKYQGCADLGICYPPQTRTLTVRLPQAAAGAAAPGAGKRLQVDFGAGAGSGGGSLLAGREALPLPPEQAFGFEAIAGDGNTLLLRFTPAEGYYLYRDRTTFELEADGIQAGAAQWPPGVDHHDEHFGDVVVYFDQVDVPLPLRRGHPRPARARLTATFQGCQTGGICYPPMTRTVAIDVPAGPITVGGASAPTRPPSATESVDEGEGAGVAPEGIGGASASAATDPRAGAEAPPTGDPSPTGDLPSTGDFPAGNLPSTGDAVPTGDAPAGDGQAEDSRLAAALSGPDRWWALASFFGFGLLLAFTPCVLPMIPILSGLIAGASAGRRLGTGRALGLSFVYVLANALVFTVAGVVAGLVGANLQIAFQNPWVLVAFAALFVALALSSFGFYELQLPAALRNRLGTLSDRQHGGSLTGVAVMGALSALIVGPCVAPPLAAAVLYIGQTQDPAFGGAALFLLAMGMGTPLLAFGVAAGKGLPTTGPWMVAVQRAFGLVFIGLAIWMLSRILPGPVTLALWAALLAAGAGMLALGAQRSRHDSLRVAGWSAAALVGLAAATQLVGAMAGSHDPLRPLAGLHGEGAAAERGLPFRPVKSLADLQREVEAARLAGQPLMLDFYADWCVSCKEMEKYTFPEPEVRAALDDFVLLKADVTANDAVDQELMKALGIIGPPATLYYVDGRERRELRLFGFEEAGEFARRAGRAAATGTTR